MVHVGFASACIVDARACVCVSPRVHRVHSVMALCDYAIAYVSHRFALLVVLRASEMHGYACGRVRVPRRWFCLECMAGRRVAGGPSRTITHDFACVGGGVGGGSFRLPVCVSCLCDRRCLCCVCMCVVAWMLVCVFYVLAICGYLWYLRTCMFAVR